SSPACCRPPAHRSCVPALSMSASLAIRDTPPSDDLPATAPPACSRRSCLPCSPHRSACFAAGRTRSLRPPPAELPRITSSPACLLQKSRALGHSSPAANPESLWPPSPRSIPSRSGRVRRELPPPSLTGGRLNPHTCPRSYQRRLLLVAFVVWRLKLTTSSGAPFHIALASLVRKRAPWPVYTRRILTIVRDCD